MPRACHARELEPCRQEGTAAARVAPWHRFLGCPLDPIRTARLGQSSTTQVEYSGNHGLASTDSQRPQRFRCQSSFDFEGGCLQEGLADREPPHRWSPPCGRFCVRSTCLSVATYHPLLLQCCRVKTRQ